MTAPDLQSLFMIEQDLEIEFKRILDAGGAATNIYRSREGLNEETPWLEVTFLVGRVNERHQYRYSDGRIYYDTWSGSNLELRVCTQRQNNAAQHKIILGRARSLVQLQSLAETWSDDCFHAITDIREAGTIHGCDTDNDLDFSTVTFSVVHNIKASAWPQPAPDFSTYLRPDGFTYLRPDGSRYIRP